MQISIRKAMAKEATSVIPHRLISVFALETITGTSTLRQLEHYKTAERTDQGRIKYCGKRVNSCGHRKWGRGEGCELGDPCTEWIRNRPIQWLRRRYARPFRCQCSSLLLGIVPNDLIMMESEKKRYRGACPGLSPKRPTCVRGEAISGGR